MAAFLDGSAGQGHVGVFRSDPGFVGISFPRSVEHGSGANPLQAAPGDTGSAQAMKRSRPETGSGEPTQGPNTAGERQPSPSGRQTFRVDRSKIGKGSEEPPQGVDSELWKDFCKYRESNEGDRKDEGDRNSGRVKLDEKYSRRVDKFSGD